MSADTVAAPRLSLNVRYNRNDQENSREEEESQVEILKDEEHHTDLRPQRARPHTQNNPAANNRRCFKAAAVTLGGFYLLILAGLFIRFILLQTRYEMLQTGYDQLSKNNSQLQREVSDISVNHSQLQTRYEMLQTKYDQLSNNTSQLQSSYQTLSKNNSQLQDEVEQLEDRTEDKSCPHGWTRFGSSCYFKSKEKDYWDGSRADCKKRGADLVVINNKEEQKFVSELSKDGESWIGLWDERRQAEWKWVDGSLLTETFWAEGLPHYDTYLSAATCCDQQGKWTQNRYYETKKRICEKKFL
ncbi:CD209 antigen-like protein C isoform X1 [Perca fluviatilis]|uniref:CD209 antigen-like protein C isoform X1 n=1 Tax=Perca fluviatilis TaxID=8168 RepID=UPI001964EF45|nr:CD209 antigen-like protein C isoform X1 [Perca fluviatilis]